MTNEEVIKALNALSAIVEVLNTMVQNMRQHHVINADEVLDEIREVRRTIHRLHSEIAK